MRPRHRSLQLNTICLILGFCSVAANACTPVHVAYVYVNESFNHEISAFDVSSDGTLTEIEGSPFGQVLGTMVGTSRANLITQDGWELYSYEIAPNGAIGKQVAQVDVSLYPGDGGFDVEAQWAVLDRAGRYVYVTYTGRSNAVQTFAIGKTGELTFKGATKTDSTYTNLNNLTVAGNDKFAFNLAVISGNSSLNAFSRLGDRALKHVGAPVVRGPTAPSGSEYFALDMASDQSDHLAVMLGTGNFHGYYLASYTIGREGELTSTNTYEDMPWVPSQSPLTVPTFDPMMMSPSGRFIAIGGGGVQFFRFNGAKPITKLRGVIHSSIDGSSQPIAWDNDDHFYAFSDDGKLHVYTVSDEGAVEAPESPYSDIPFCGTNNGQIDCLQTMTVRSDHSD
jgi:hypothetical protein